MSEAYRAMLEQIRRAYVSVQGGALRPAVWKREGASSYTVQRDDAKTSAVPAQTSGTVNTGAPRT
jgi:hypothetical protein